jgi:hypothetical protein
MPRPLQMRPPGAVRHGPDRLAEGDDDLVEGAERPKLGIRAELVPPQPVALVLPWTIAPAC